jgi:hypothetical protein
MRPRGSSVYDPCLSSVYVPTPSLFEWRGFLYLFALHFPVDIGFDISFCSGMYGAAPKQTVAW